MHPPLTETRCRTADLTATREVADMAVVEDIQTGTMITPEAIPTVTPAKTTPKTIPTGMKPLV